MKPLDYENVNSYTMKVYCKDEMGADATANMIVQILDVNDPPVITTTTFSASETASIGSTVCQFGGPCGGGSKLVIKAFRRPIFLSEQLWQGHLE